MAMRKTAFTRYLIHENGLDKHGFQGWVFDEGMLFNSRRKWWGDRGSRNAAHEGLDFLYFSDRLGRVLQLGRSTRVPVMYEGVLTCITDDFLGRSVIVAHEIAEAGRPLLSIYGHMDPAEGLHPGKTLREGSVLGTLAGSGESKVPVQPHLHVSLGWASDIGLCRDLDWKKLGDPGIITMLDPLLVIDSDYRVLPPQSGGTRNDGVRVCIS